MAAPATLSTDLTQAVLVLYSAQLLHNALGTMQWLNFATEREDLLINKGQTVTFTKYDDLTGDPELTEGTALTEAQMSADTVSITVTEQGKATSVSEKLVNISWEDVLAEAALLLARHYAVWGPDAHIKKTVMENAGNTIYANGRAGRTSIVEGDNLDTDVIREGVETLQTLNAPKYNAGGDEFYVCMIHPRQARYLRQDPDWVAAANYHGTRNIFNGEIGRFEDVVFVVSSYNYHGAAAAATDPSWYTADADAANDLTSGNDGNQVNIYMAHMLADMSVGFASALPVELRDAGVRDFGRNHGLAWYALYGSGMIHPNYALNIETA